MKPSLLLLLVVAACLPTTETAEGPSISVRVLTEPFTIRDVSPEPFIETNTTSGNYEMTIDVQTTFGETARGTSYSYAPIASLAGSVTPPGLDLTTADFTFDTSTDSIHRRDYTGTTLISIPGTMMGQRVTFTMQATDDNGLTSNRVEFSAELR